MPIILAMEDQPLQYSSWQAHNLRGRGGLKTLEKFSHPYGQMCWK